jgi:hypothetical protein
MESMPAQETSSSKKVITTLSMKCFKLSVLLNLLQFLFLVGMSALGGMQWEKDLELAEKTSNVTLMMYNLEQGMNRVLRHTDHVVSEIAAKADLADQMSSPEGGTKNVGAVCKRKECAPLCLASRSKSFMGYISEAVPMISPLLSQIPGIGGLLSSLTNTLPHLVSSVHGIPSMTDLARRCASRVYGPVRGGNSQGVMQALESADGGARRKRSASMELPMSVLETGLANRLALYKTTQIPFGMDESTWILLQALEDLFGGDLSLAMWQSLIETTPDLAAMVTSSPG